MMAHSPIHRQQSTYEFSCRGQGDFWWCVRCSLQIEFSTMNSETKFATFFNQNQPHHTVWHWKRIFFKKKYVRVHFQVRWTINLSQMWKEKHKNRTIGCSLAHKKKKKSMMKEKNHNTKIRSYKSVYIEIMSKTLSRNFIVE